MAVAQAAPKLSSATAAARGQRGVVHGFENHSGAMATCLCTLTPGVLGPEYFRELADLIDTGLPDEAKVHEIMLRHGLVPA